MELNVRCNTPAAVGCSSTQARYDGSTRMRRTEKNPQTKTRNLHARKYSLCKQARVVNKIQEERAVGVSGSY